MRDVAIQVVGRLWNLALGVIVVVVITRALGVDGNGKWTTLLAISSITAYIIDPGLQTATIRLAAAQPAREASWLGALLSLRLATGIVAALACFGASLAVAQGASMVVAAALIAATALSSPLQALVVVFQLRVRNDRTIAFLTLNSLLWAAGAVVVALLGGGLVAFAATFVATSTAAWAVQGAFVWRRTPVVLAGVRQYQRELVRVGLAVGVASALTVVYGKIDQVLVLHFEGTQGAGLYGAAYSLLDRVQFLPMVLMTTVFPIVSAAWPADSERARRAVRRALGYMAIVSFPALAFTLAAARPLLVALFGASFAPAAGALKVLIVAFIPTCFGYVTGSLAVVVGRQRTFVFIALGGLVFNVVGNLLLIPRFGYLAAAWMTLATEIAVIGPAMLTTLTVMHVAPDWRRLPRAAIAAAAMGVVVWLTSRVGAGIVVLAALAATVYPVAVLVTGTLTLEERRELTSRLLRRGAQP